jgi:hypothetical protein
LPFYQQEPDSEKNSRIVTETDYYFSRQLLLNDFNIKETVKRINDMISHINRFEMEKAMLV